MIGATVRRLLVILQDAPRRPFQILVLPRVERPKEGGEACQSEQERARDKPSECSHLKATLLVRNLNAFAVTAKDDADMAIAARRGVT